jgi:hypothetical protein
VPTAEEVQPDVEERPEQGDELPITSTPTVSDAERTRLHELVDRLSSRDMEMARTFLEFLLRRHHSRAPGPKAVSEVPVVAVTRSAETE